MPDAIFSDPRLAAVYDAFDGVRDDLAAYRALAAELGARRVLDIGCGTGSLAVLLAADSVEVIGADPAAASLSIARAKLPREPGVRWVHTDATGLPRVDADLAVMTGNVAQVFCTAEEWARVLTSAHDALTPGGHLVFETRRPEDEAWRRWASEDTAPLTLDVPGVGPVERRFELTEVALPLVSFRYTFRFAADGTTLTSDSTLRFHSYAEITASLEAAAFQLLDVREAPDRPGREHVFVAARPA